MCVFYGNIIVFISRNECTFDQTCIVFVFSITSILFQTKLALRSAPELFWTGRYIRNALFLSQLYCPVFINMFNCWLLFFQTHYGN